MPCLHPHSETFVPQSRRGKTAPKQRARHPLPFSGSALIHSQRTTADRSRDHAPDVSDTWLSEAASELRPSWREARRLMLEAHRLPESARFVEADSRSVKAQRAGKTRVSATPEALRSTPFYTQNASLSEQDFAMQNQP